jgi:hypothetical protein
MKPFDAVFHAQNDITKNLAIEMLERKLADPRSYPPGMYAQKRYDAAYLELLKQLPNVAPEEMAAINQMLSNLQKAASKEFEQLREQACTLADDAQGARPSVVPQPARKISPDENLARRVIEIEAAPDQHPTMSLSEAAFLLKRPKGTVREWGEKGWIAKNEKGNFLTASVLSYRKKLIKPTP